MMCSKSAHNRRAVVASKFVLCTMMAAIFIILILGSFEGSRASATTSHRSRSQSISDSTAAPSPSPSPSPLPSLSPSPSPSPSTLCLLNRSSRRLERLRTSPSSVSTESSSIAADDDDDEADRRIADNSSHEESLPRPIAVVTMREISDTFGHIDAVGATEEYKAKANEYVKNKFIEISSTKKDFSMMATQSSPLPPPRRRFQLLGLLGRGGFGRVFKVQKADDDEDSSIYALKAIDTTSKEAKQQYIDAEIYVSRNIVVDTDWRGLLLRVNSYQWLTVFNRFCRLPKPCHRTNTSQRHMKCSKQMSLCSSCKNMSEDAH